MTTTTDAKIAQDVRIVCRAILDIFVTTGEEATVKQIADKIGKSSSWVNRVVATNQFQMNGMVSFTETYVPVRESNYNTIIRQRKAAAWLPSRRWLCDLWQDAQRQRHALQDQLNQK